MLQNELLITINSHQNSFFWHFKILIYEYHACTSKLFQNKELLIAASTGKREKVIKLIVYEADVEYVDKVSFMFCTIE